MGSGFTGYSRDQGEERAGVGSAVAGAALLTWGRGCGGEVSECEAG